MSYFAPYIDRYGLHTPTYEEIRDDLIEGMKQIFGSDIYLGEDSQDYQQISIFAKKIYDTNNLAMLVYNNKSPNTAVGVGLDNLCALVGITRKPATHSNAQLVITGEPSTVIVDGKASDGTHVWDLPSEVTIPENGSITVDATCEDSGSVTALPNTINQIVTPQFGWLGVTNQQSANPGNDVETDGQLRGRYAFATYQPSRSVLDGIYAAISEIPEVSKVKVYENDGGGTNEFGHPGHSITAVVKGGRNEEIGEAIFYKKTVGCYTNGNTSVPMITNAGNPVTIRFERPMTVELQMTINIFKLSGWSSVDEDEMKIELQNYVNGMEIAEKLTTSAVITTILSKNTLTNPAFNVLEISIGRVGQGDETQNGIFDTPWNGELHLQVTNIEVNYENE